MTDFKKIAKDGLWGNNPGLVQLLGLCPLLAVTATVSNALGLALATLLVLVGSNILVSLIRNHVPKAIRIPIFVMIIAALVSCVQLLINAYAYGLYLSLGIFLPLIVTNCVIIGRAEAFASRNSPLPSAFDGLMMSIGFAIVLVILGAIREVLGQGTLFAGMHLLFGGQEQDYLITLFDFDAKFLLAILPPGAFFAMGLIIAFKNYVDDKQSQKRVATEAAPTIERARVTGKI